MYINLYFMQTHSMDLWIYIWLVVDLPLWKMMEFVSWDDEIPNMMGKIKNVPNHQPVLCKAPKILGSMLPICPSILGSRGFRTPIAGWFPMENPRIKWTIWGYPMDWKAPYLHLLCMHTVLLLEFAGDNYLCAEDKRLAQELSAIPKKKRAECVTPSQVTKPCLQTKFHVHWQTKGWRNHILLEDLKVPIGGMPQCPFLMVKPCQTPLHRWLAQLHRSRHWENWNLRWVSRLLPDPTGGPKHGLCSYVH